MKFVSSLIVLFTVTALVTGCATQSEVIQSIPSSAIETSPEPTIQPSIELTKNQAGVICPFVVDFLNDYPRANLVGINMSVAGQSKYARLNHSIAIGYVAEYLLASGALQPTIPLANWQILASALNSGEYQQSGYIPNDVEATAALNALKIACGRAEL